MRAFKKILAFVLALGLLQSQCAFALTLPDGTETHPAAEGASAADDNPAPPEGEDTPDAEGNPDSPESEGAPDTEGNPDSPEGEGAPDAEGNPDSPESEGAPDTEGNPDSPEGEGAPAPLDPDAPPADEPAPDANLVYDEDALIDWLTAHASTGGQVLLGSHITLTRPVLLYGAPLVIDTGAYGLTYDGGALLMDNYTLIGEGVDMPVLEVQRIGGRMLNWNTVIQPMHITAYGRDGQGGTALRIAQDDGYAVSLMSMTDEGEIVSYGQGAVGVSLAENMSVYCLNVRTEGADSMAVYAPHGGNLYYCKLFADGQGAASAAGSDAIAVDTCTAQPAPATGTRVHYRIAEAIGRSMYLPVKQGASYIEDSDLYTFLLCEDGGQMVADFLYADFSTAFSAVDTSTPGTYTVHGSLYAPFLGLGLEDNFSLTLTIEVRDPSLPTIGSFAFASTFEGEKYVNLFLWDSYDPADGTVTLRRSDDGGKSWTDITHAPEITWYDDVIQFASGAITAPIQLQLESMGAYSNIVTLQNNLTDTAGPHTGDRTGVDRIVIVQPPAVQPPVSGTPAEDEPPAQQPQTPPVHQPPATPQPAEPEHPHTPLTSEVPDTAAPTAAAPDAPAPDAAAGANPSSAAQSQRDAAKDLPHGAHDPRSIRIRPAAYLTGHPNQAAAPPVETITPPPAEAVEAAETAEIAAETAAETASQTLTQPAAQPHLPISAADSAMLLALGAVLLCLIAFVCVRLFRGKGPYAYVLCSLFVLALTAAACLALYTYDNKYTAAGPQAENGLLSLPAGTAERTVFLTEGWEYYGGRLLSPADFTAQTIAPDAFIYIGQYGGFEAADPSRSPHGSATYRLRIALPAQPQAYMLELPEIFSAYRVYLNGDLVQSVGEPDPAHYRPETGNRAVSVRAGGSLEILIAVSDFSHLYSGMVYPPAFGEPEAVLQLLAARQIFRSLLIAFTLAIGVISLLIGLLGKKKKTALLYSLLCLFFAGYTAYPLLQTLLTGFYPLYALENSSFCALLVVVMLLCRRIYHTHDRWGWLFIGFGGLVCAGSLALPFLLPHGSLAVMHAYSLLVMACQWLTAAYLTAMTARAVRRNSQHALPLLIGILVFGAALVMDRLLPLFEPIVTGWFVELAGFVLVFCIGITVAKEIAVKFRDSIVLEERAHSMAHLLSIQRANYDLLLDGIEKTRAARHDLRHHMVMLTTLVQSRDMDQLAAYIQQFASNILHTQPAEPSRNVVVEVLAQHYAQLAKRNGIDMQMKLHIEQDTGILDVDLCAVLSNLLENAVEAAMRQTEGKPFLTLAVQQSPSVLSIQVNNSTDGKVKQQNGSFVSSKAENRRGYGLESIRHVAARYHGETAFTHDATRAVFQSTVLLARGSKMQAV